MNNTQQLIEALSPKFSGWLIDTKARQRQRERWGILWKPRLKIIIKYYRWKRILKNWWKP